MATGHLRRRVGTKGEISYQLIVEGERDPITGKRERRYKTVKGNKKQAEAALRKMIADYESGGVAVVSAMKFGDWLDQWLSLYCPNIQATTRASYKEKIKNHIVPCLGHIPLKALKANNIQAWINDMAAKGLSPKTIRNAYNNLNSALKKAVILRMIPYNPSEGIELPKLKKYTGKVYDAAGIKTALAAAKGTRMYLILLLLVSVGIRRGELAALKWDAIDFNKKTIHIYSNRVIADGEIITKPPKTESSDRTITVGNKVLAELGMAKLEYNRRRMELGAGFYDLGYVIHKGNGQPYRPDSITQMWIRFLKRNQLDYIRLHDLRHTNATTMVAAGVDYNVVKERLGHSNISTTINIYTHVLPSMDKKAADKLEETIFDAAVNS